MTIGEFTTLIGGVVKEIGDHPLDQRLEARLNRFMPAPSPQFQQLFAACREGIRDGWMCRHGAANLRYGRVLKPSAELAGFSVDVVEMTDVVGPYHAHPNGEIDLVMPIDSAAEFDGRKAGWVVYGPNSAHSPTVLGGQALVLYLLPEGAIDFKAAAA